MALNFRKLAIGGGALALVVAAVVVSSQPEEVPVDMAAVARGPMLVTVDADGQTEIRGVHEVSAPVGGKVLRSPLSVGERVTEGASVVARIQPGAPAFLDERSRAQAHAAVAQAEAALSLAAAQIRSAEFDLNNSQRSLNRLHDLHERGTIPPVQLEQAELALDLAATRLDSAHATEEMRQSELTAARAALISPEEDEGAEAPNCCISIHAPISGQVLSIVNESARMVAPGTTLLTIGDPANMEVTVELLSSDAVRLSPGAAAFVERWGGGYALAATLSEIEPSAFTKISALGIEEQRVRVRLQFDEGQDLPALGHGFRVYARIAEWQSDDALTVPISALFRDKGAWSVFVVEEGVAQVRKVDIGQRNNDMAEVLDGLDAGEVVITHPSDRVAADVMVVDRETLGQ